jgi:hypothetical protein
LIDRGDNLCMSRKWIALVAVIAAVNASLWLATGVLGSAADAVQNQLFGSAMVRAEVVVQQPDGLHDIRVDRGKVVSVSGTSLTLKEKDGSVVTLELSPTVSVTVNGGNRGLKMLKARMTVQWAIRDGDGPVTRIVAFTR